MKQLTLFFLLITSTAYSQSEVSNIKLKNGTTIFNAAKGYDWSDYETIGWASYSERDTLIIRNDNESLLYEGNWQYGTNCNCTYTNEKHNSIVFRFTNATDFEFWGEKMSHQGFADIYINGEFKEEIDTYSLIKERPSLNFRMSGLDSTQVYTFRLIVKDEKRLYSLGSYIVIQHFRLYKSRTGMPSQKPIFYDISKREKYGVFVHDTLRYEQETYEEAIRQAIHLSNSSDSVIIKPPETIIKISHN